jgi:SM-20-related protein
MRFSDAQVIALGEGRPILIDDALPVAEITAARALADQLRYRSAGVGRDRVLDSRVRGDSIAWLEDTDDAPGWAPVRQLLADVRAAANEAAWLGLVDEEIQVARYADGAQYARHVDAIRGDPARALTAILYLNPGWQPEDGGELEVWVDETSQRIAPIGGRLVVFLSARLAHAVRPALRPRYAVTAWYRTRPRI